MIEAYYAVNSGMNAIALGSLNQAAMIGAVAGVVNQIVKEQQDKEKAPKRSAQAIDYSILSFLGVKPSNGIIAMRTRARAAVRARANANANAVMMEKNSPDGMTNVGNNIKKKSYSNNNKMTDVGNTKRPVDRGLKLKLAPMDMELNLFGEGNGLGSQGVGSGGNGGYGIDGERLITPKRMSRKDQRQVFRRQVRMPLLFIIVI